MQTSALLCVCVYVGGWGSVNVDYISYKQQQQQKQQKQQFYNY